MSRIYVDRISPYQSGSVTVDGLSFDTGSLATTGSNTFNGNQTVNGKVATTIPLPGSGFEFLNTYTGITGSNNEPLPDSWDAIYNLGGLNSGFARNIGDLSKNINVRFLHNPNSIGFLNQPSGSGNVGSHYLYQDGTDIKFDLDATNIRIGGGFTENIELSGSVKVLNGLEVGNTVIDTQSQLGIYGSIILRSGSGITTDGAFGPAVPFDSPVDFYSGIGLQNSSINGASVIELTPQDPLPAGTLGQLAVSGSNLYYHNGSSWSQIN